MNDANSYADERDPLGITKREREKREREREKDREREKKREVKIVCLTED